MKNKEKSLTGIEYVENANFMISVKRGTSKENSIKVTRCELTVNHKTGEITW